MSCSVSGKTVARFFAVLIAVPALTDPASAAEGATATPDFSGLWGRNSIDFEPPLSGPGPVVNLSRLPNGTRDIDNLVGDYNIQS